MNKRGQTLIIFVMLIPIILTMAALVIDVGLLYYKKNEYVGIVEESIKEYFKDENLTSALETLTLNGVSLDDVEVSATDEKISVTLDTKVDSIFGKVIRINDYEIKVSRVGTKDKERVIINKKE